LLKHFARTASRSAIMEVAGADDIDGNGAR
jgi:hypothetical protein